MWKLFLDFTAIQIPDISSFFQNFLPGITYISIDQTFLWRCICFDLCCFLFVFFAFIYYIVWTYFYISQTQCGHCLILNRHYMNITMYYTVAHKGRVLLTFTIRTICLHYLLFAFFLKYWKHVTYCISKLPKYWDWEKWEKIRMIWFVNFKYW